MLDDEDIKQFTEKLENNTDVARAMIELFKDELSIDKKKNDIDLRTRLFWKGVKSHSVIQFLQGITVEETKNQLNLAEGLEILSTSLKRHSVSFEGKSRNEIVELFKSELANKQLSGGALSMFRPQG